MGAHWQVRERFSNNQKAKYQNALRRSRLPFNNKDLKALNMVCQVHSGQPVVEFKCHGPCSLYKHRDKFSKSQRRNKLRVSLLLLIHPSETNASIQWCLECVAWRSQFDIGDVPVAHPNEDLSQADVAGDSTDTHDERALLEKYPFDYDLDEDIRDDDLGGADDIDSDVDDEYPGAATVFHGYSDNSDDEDDDYYQVRQISATPRMSQRDSDTDQSLDPELASQKCQSWSIEPSRHWPTSKQHEHSRLP